MKVLVAFNQKALIMAFSMIVNTSLTFVCSSIVLALLTHILADSGHGEDRGGVQQQCRVRQFSDTGDCSRTSDAHLNQHFGLWITELLLVQILPLSNFHFLKFSAIFLLFDSALLLQKW